MAKPHSIIPSERIVSKIYYIRKKKVMFDDDLAELYGVETGALNRAVKRNRERFPEDFMFQLTWEETDLFLRSQFVTLKRGQHRKYRPYVFSEQGVAMLSSVLRSKRAVEVNIAIIRTFVKLREILVTHTQLRDKIMELEKTQRHQSKQLKVIFETIKQLIIQESEEVEKRQIGFDVGN